MIVRVLTRLSRMHRDDLCFICGYNSTADPCPECGTSSTESINRRLVYDRRRGVLMLVLASLLCPTTLTLYMLSPALGGLAGLWMLRLLHSIVGVGLLLLLVLLSVAFSPLLLGVAWYYRPDRARTFSQSFKRAINETPAWIPVLLYINFFAALPLLLLFLGLLGYSRGANFSMFSEWFPPLLTLPCALAL